MTTTTSHEVDRLRGGHRRARTLAGAIAARLIARSLELGHGVTSEQWPSARYRDDPVLFAREVLGIEPWARQIEVLEAIRDYPRVAVASGHKVSKSHTAAIIALWYFCSFPDARVVLTSVTARQVDQILWRELRMMHSRAKVTIGGELRDLARTGLRADDFREVVGFTAREAEAVAGISGKHLLYIPDEASGIDDSIFEAIEGNRAGGARIVMFSNPTRTEGEFFRAFHEKSQFYKCIRISSEETPNVVEGRLVIPGLATREWVEEKRREWGESSPLYKVRVKGEFVLREEGKILSIAAITEAEQRWIESDTSSPNERLQIGIDPAGPGDGGDEFAFVVRRGLRVLEVLGWHGLTEQSCTAHLLALIDKHRGRRETVLVTIDMLGPIGGSVYGQLRAAAEVHKTFEVYGVRSSDRAFRQPQIYDRVRDELWANLAQWFRDGGSIPEDTRLARELHAPAWAQHISGRLKATPKDELRKALDGRSPDRADALTLSVWVPAAIRSSDVARGRDEAGERDRSRDHDPVRSMDPYGGLGAWGPGRR